MRSTFATYRVEYVEGKMNMIGFIEARSSLEAGAEFIKQNPGVQMKAIMRTRR